MINKCPNCGSTKHKKSGFTKLGTQLYKCKDCNRIYSNTKGRGNYNNLRVSVELLTTLRQLARQHKMPINKYVEQILINTTNES